jgi:hypothetical protein
MELAIEPVGLPQLAIGGYGCEPGAALIRHINALFAKAGFVSATWQYRHFSFREVRYCVRMIHRFYLWLIVDIQSGKPARPINPATGY